jgi:hypothetical protein
MKRKSSSRPEMEETVASAFDVRNSFLEGAPTAATGEKVET